MAITKFGDISNRTAGHLVRKFLEVGHPHLPIEQFAEAYVMPTNETKTAKWRRYEKFPLPTAAVVEGITPSSVKPTTTDVETTLQQMIQISELTDVVADTHEDNVLQQMIERISEAMSEALETRRFWKLRAGTNVLYTNGTSRSEVNTPISIDVQRRATRILKNNLAKPITKVISASTNFATEPVAASYVALVHPNQETDIRKMSGFVPTESYGQMKPYTNEIGKVEDVRYIYSTIFEPWEDAGGTYNGSGTAMLSTTGTNADVYPIILLGQMAYATVALRGKNSVTPTVLNPNTPTKDDPASQRGYVSAKTYHSSVILNDAWMLRIEAAATA